MAHENEEAVCIRHEFIRLGFVRAETKKHERLAAPSGARGRAKLSFEGAAAFRGITSSPDEECSIVLRSDSCIDFLGGARARKEIEVKDKSVAFAASGGERFALVLEFEFLSRIIASMQSMRHCRQDWRAPAMRSGLGCLVGRAL
jgi:hypothetical protein